MKTFSLTLESLFNESELPSVDIITNSAQFQLLNFKSQEEKESFTSSNIVLNITNFLFSSSNNNYITKLGINYSGNNLLYNPLFALQIQQQNNESKNIYLGKTGTLELSNCNICELQCSVPYKKYNNITIIQTIEGTQVQHNYSIIVLDAELDKLSIQGEYKTISTN